MRHINTANDFLIQGYRARHCVNTVPVAASNPSRQDSGACSGPSIVKSYPSRFMTSANRPAGSETSSSSRAITISRSPAIGEILSSCETSLIRHAPSILVITGLPLTIFVSRAIRATTRSKTFCGALFRRSRLKRINAGLWSDIVTVLGVFISARQVRRLQTIRLSRPTKPKPRP